MVGWCCRAGWPFLLSLLTACGATPLRGQPDLLDFLEDGVTTRDEVVKRLGVPLHCLDEGKACTYRLGHDEAGQFVARGNEVTGWRGLDGSVVVVYDAHGVLQRHAFVPVRNP